MNLFSFQVRLWNEQHDYLYKQRNGINLNIQKERDAQMNYGALTQWKIMQSSALREHEIK